MSNKNTFDRLVGEISKDERKQLLEKLGAANTEQKPLVQNFNDSFTDASVDLDLEYRKLGLFQRIILLIKKLFSGKEVLVLLEEAFVSSLKKRIESKAPGLYNSEKNELREAFLNEIRELAKSLSFVNPLVEKILDDENKKEFFSFLAGMEMQLVQEELQKELDPNKIKNEKFLNELGEIKREQEFRLNTILDGITDIEKNTMYSHAKALNCIKLLAEFPYRKIITAFKISEGFVSCSIKAIEQDLKTLCRILSGFMFPPAPVLMESLIMFSIKDDLDIPGTDIEAILTDKMNSFKKLLARIRQFNSNVPLVDILKISTGQINFTAEKINGGEDWYNLFCRFWKEKAKVLMDIFSVEFRKTALLNELKTLFSIKDLPLNIYYSNSRFGVKNILKYELGFSVMKAFYENLFVKTMNSGLKRILIDGEFYKEQNRKEYTDAYNFFIGFQKEIEKFEIRLQDDKELAAAIKDVKKQPIAAALKEKKIAEILVSFDREAERFLKDCKTALNSLANVINGILYGESGGRYDTLSNKSFIAGTNNAQFIKELINTADVLSKFNTYYTEIEELLLNKDSFK